MRRLAPRPSAKSPHSHVRAGDFTCRSADGSLLRVTVIPVAERERSDRDWLAIDRPAALIHVSAPEDQRRRTLAELALKYGLTRAEAAVALEIAVGDGRAAAAARLGIRESTVRTHLSAIFDKMGIRRQAELVRLVGR